MTTSAMHRCNNKREEAKENLTSSSIASKTTDFSIERILSGNESLQSRSLIDDDHFASASSANQTTTYPWLTCTRYAPPKIPRPNNQRTGDSNNRQRRQLGKHPRIPFTGDQLTALEERYRVSRYLTAEQVTELSDRLRLPDVRVKIWFQNRRARERRERLHKEQSAVTIEGIFLPQRYSHKTTEMATKETRNCENEVDRADDNSQLLDFRQ